MFTELEGQSQYFINDSLQKKTMEGHKTFSHELKLSKKLTDKLKIANYLVDKIIKLFLY